MDQKHTAFGIGVYLKEEYAEILKISADREGMDATWEEWLKNKENVVKQFRKRGYIMQDVLVRPKELLDYCVKHRLVINGESRSQFINHKLSEELK